MRRNRWWLIALGALFLSRYISMLTGLATTTHMHDPFVWAAPHFNPGGGITHGAGGWFTMWDSYWYLDAAQNGWPHHFNPHVQNTTGFFPALPLLLRFVHGLLGGSWVLTGFVTEMLIQIPAVVAVAALARRVLEERQADLAVILFCFFPGTYVFSQVYTEPLFILATAVCLYGLHRRNWWMAGLGAALAGVTRPTGIILIACCAWVAAREIWRRDDWKALIAPALAPLGLLGFSLFLLARTGTARAYMLTQQDSWSQTFSLQAIPHELILFFGNHKPPNYGPIGVSYIWVLLLFLLWSVIGLVLLGILVWRKQMPMEWFWFCLGATLTCVITDGVGDRPRMALLTFPLIFAYAAYLKRWYTALPAVGLSIAGLAFLSQSLPGFIP